MLNKYKFTSIFGLKPGVDPDETWSKWISEHALYAKQLMLPDVKEYWINRVIRRFDKVDVGDVWGIPEFWYDDLQSISRAMERLQGAEPDDFHMMYITPAKRMIVEEEIVSDFLVRGQERRPMVRFFSILRLKPGIDSDQAYDYWRQKHAAWAQGILAAKKYTINRVIRKFPGAGGKGGDFDIFGYSLCWFDDEQTAERAVERLQGTEPDEFMTKYVNTPQRVITQTKQIDLSVNQ